MLLPGLNCLGFQCLTNVTVFSLNLIVQRLRYGLDQWPKEHGFFMVPPE